MRTRGENFLKEEEALLFSERGFFRGVGGKFVFLGSFGAWLQRKGKNRFLGFAKWFSLWSVAPPARGAGGIPTSPLCPPGPPIPPSNGRGIPPDPPCGARGTSPCFLTDRSRIGHALCLVWGPLPIGCRGAPALCLALEPRYVPSQGFPAAAAPCHHSRDKPAPRSRGRDQLRRRRQWPSQGRT